MVEKIVSGGQTGVDRAALDVALELNIPCGGWCPKGRIAEDGTIPDRYPLIESPSAAYEERTEWNVRDSDGTLILATFPPTGGTAYTLYLIEVRGKPFIAVDLDRMVENKEVFGKEAERVAVWIEEEEIEVLNVAGPRESKQPGITDLAAGLLRKIMILSAVHPKTPDGH